MSVALVTGGSRGLGLATAQELAAHGARVVVGVRDAEAGRAAVTAIRGEATWVALDVTDVEAARAAATTVEHRYGGLDLLVNNAGVLPEATNADPREVLDAGMFRETFETNVLGAVNVLEAFLPLLRRSAHGRIVNISTTMGSLQEQLNPDSPYYGMVVPAYQSSKAALNAITIALSKLLADTPVTVTSVCPGFVRTDLTPVNQDQAPLSAEQAAQTVVTAALGATTSGTFVDANGPVPW